MFGSCAFGGDLDSDWLTDSLNFRIYIGTYDDARGGISYRCNNDSVYTIQTPDGTAKSPKKHWETKYYAIEDLITKQNIKTAE